MIALRQDADLNAETSVSFDPEVMKRLYAEGQGDGEAGPKWAYVPPVLSPGDGDYARGSAQLRTMSDIHSRAP
jgi:hypothetical protein